GGRLLQQRDAAVETLRQIPGVSVVKPQGGLYVFPKLDPAIYAINDDQQMTLDLLSQQNILTTHGSGFNWPHPDHLRIVTLPPVNQLSEAIKRLGNYLGS